MDEAFRVVSDVAGERCGRVRPAKKSAEGHCVVADCLGADRPPPVPAVAGLGASLSLPALAYAASRSPTRPLVCSSRCVRSSASQARVCSKRQTRARRTRNCMALRQGRSPSRAVTFVNE